MNKRQLIDAIRELNEHATEIFLQQFAENDLSEYLVRLREASTRNVRLTRWRRPARREYRMVS
ncbi:MAG TPA: hypothetical protein VF624_14645 [Tepidisphaeraceae bacterium]|jgi:hypothetical protein